MATTTQSTAGKTLVPSEAHEFFNLDKKEVDDMTIGMTNERHVLCQFCEIDLIPAGNAIKVYQEVDLA